MPVWLKITKHAKINTDTTLGYTEKPLVNVSLEKIDEISMSIFSGETY